MSRKGLTLIFAFSLVALGGLVSSQVSTTPANASVTTLSITPDVVEQKDTVTNQLKYPHASFGVSAGLPLTNTNSGVNGGIDVAMTVSQTAVASAATSAGYSYTANTVLCSLSYTFSGYSQGNGGMGILAFDNRGTELSPTNIPDSTDYSGSSYAGIYFSGSSSLGDNILVQGPPLNYRVVSPENQPPSSTTVRSISSDLDISSFDWNALEGGKLTIYAYAVGGGNGSAAEQVTSVSVSATVAESSCSSTPNDSSSSAPKTPSASSSSAPKKEGNPGIFLTVTGHNGKEFEGSEVIYGSFAILSLSPYQVTLQSITNPTGFNRVLASGRTDRGGHLEATLSLPRVEAGNYRIILSGTGFNGELLKLTNHVNVDGFGKFTSVSAERLQPLLP